MGRLTAVVFLTVLFSSNALAAGINKSNSFTVENEPNNNTWTAACDISVGGIDQNQIYSGVMLFQRLISGAGSADQIFSITFQVDPQNSTYSEINPGVYKFTAKLKGKTLTAVADVRFASLVGGDRLFCDSRLDRGLPGSPTTIFGSNMAATVQQP
jgi:hypothetical protein